MKLEPLSAYSYTPLPGDFIHEVATALNLLKFAARRSHIRLYAISCSRVRGSRSVRECALYELTYNIVFSVAMLCTLAGYLYLYNESASND